MFGRMHGSTAPVVHEPLLSPELCCRSLALAAMVRISVLGDALKTMFNAEKRGKRQVLLRPASKVVIKFLQLMQRHGYIGEFELVDDHRGGKIVVELNGRLNKCGVMSPRYDTTRRPAARGSVARSWASSIERAVWHTNFQ
ncbi:40S ribosomal protein S15a, partial [Haematococcus lacustris]